MNSDTADRPVILVVDDLPDLIDLYTDYFGAQGFEVVAARDGEEALEAARQRTPVVIIMDLGMPNLDGCNATRALKRRPETRGVPIIVVTANVAAIHVNDAWSAGADAVLSKPLELAILKLAIGHALRKEPIPREYSVIPRH